MHCPKIKQYENVTASNATSQLAVKALTIMHICAGSSEPLLLCVGSASSQGSDDHARLRRIVRTFAAIIHKVLMTQDTALTSYQPDSITNIFAYISHRLDDPAQMRRTDCQSHCCSHTQYILVQSICQYGGVKKC